MTDKKEKKEKVKSKEHDSSKHVDVEPTIDEALDEEKGVLSVSQRKARGRNMKKHKAKVRLGRERASRKKASLDKLKKRATKKALGMIKDKLSGKKPYKSLSPAEKVAVDKKVSKLPSSRVARIAKSLLPSVKKGEMERIEKRRTKKEDVDLEGLMSVTESLNVNIGATAMAEAIIIDKLLTNMDSAVMEGIEFPLSLAVYKAINEHDLSISSKELMALYKKEYIGEEAMYHIDRAIGSEIASLDEETLTRWVATCPVKKTLSESADDKFSIAKSIVENKGECKLVPMKQMKAFEKVVDKLFSSFDIDFSFTKHFADRMGDGRNDPCIDLKDLADTFKKLYAKMKKDGSTLSKHKDTEVVLKDLQQDLNLPLAIEYDRKTSSRSNPNPSSNRDNRICI